MKLARPAWFGCACCPPNLARLLTSLDKYIYTIHDQSIYTNLYLTNQSNVEIDGQKIRIEQMTNYPWEGKIQFSIHTNQAVRFAFALRIPNWSKTYSIFINGERHTGKIVNGYVSLDRQWNDGDTIVLELDMKIHLWTANPHVRSDLNKVAVQRGPIVYCAEGKDNGSDLQLVHFTEQTKFQYQFKANQFNGVGIITANAEKLKIGSQWEQTLYREAVKQEFSPVTLTLIPYYCWANRGENEMLIWFHKK